MLHFSSNRSDWRLDAVSILAILGESNIKLNSHLITSTRAMLSTSLDARSAGSAWRAADEAAAARGRHQSSRRRERQQVRRSELLCNTSARESSSGSELFGAHRRYILRIPS